ncbi:uncharacterized protein HD556DRAFT_1303256 [Suillus plorans]|uniref:Uncharacterized protein n=1 Tax=Suillus plorans TaxID=116603 RepID=A0A9P7J7U7_9AGAM|nr:uncharacterized protein HD556DRAFT_1303256 [Suillus plorans]KAG1806903.1 hypothetical protein HD556DRAFT_1303256 [Suillus plorans]
MSYFVTEAWTKGTVSGRVRYCDILILAVGLLMVGHSVSINGLATRWANHFGCSHELKSHPAPSWVQAAAKTMFSTCARQEFLTSASSAELQQKELLGAWLRQYYYYALLGTAPITELPTCHYQHSLVWFGWSPGVNSSILGGQNYGSNYRKLAIEFRSSNFLQGLDNNMFVTDEDAGMLAREVQD